jgi:hypothetical protein
MQSACSTGNRVFGFLFLFLASVYTGVSQDNSPLSRYGLGDLVPSANIANRGMGYGSAAYNDFQTINFVNPASYRRFGMQRAILDIGMDINSRTLRNNAGTKYTSSNAIIPYLAGAFQLSGEKMKRDWGVAFGLRPVTRVSYNIQTGSRMRSGDSVITNYEGNGGSYQAFAGTGIGFKNLSIGINGGYRFGSKDYTTRVLILNDTVPDRYTAGQRVVRNNFGGAFLDLGLQYHIPLSKNSSLDLGVYGSLQSKMRATRDEKNETFFVVDDAGTTSRIDSVSEIKNIRGDIQYPSTYGFGLMYDVQGKGKLNVVLDFVQQKWADYRYYGSKDLLQDSWQIRTGAQFVPDLSGKSKSYWGGVLYRIGFFTGKEPYTVLGNLNNTGVTIGAGLPIRKFSFAEFNRNNIVNLALEIGQRGNKQSSLRENYFRFSVGFSLSDIWFIKRKYD